MPESFSPPGAVIQAGSPFMEATEVYGVMRVRFNLYLIVEDDEQLEEKIASVAGLLTDYDIESIEVQPEIDGGVLAGARLIITAEADKEELFNHA